MNKVLLAIQKWLKKPLARNLAFLCLCYSLFVLGVSSGFYWGTGSLPIVGTQSIYAPVPETSIQDVNTLRVFLDSDDTHLNEYDVGFNCVEYGLLLARNAQWAGLPADVIRLVYENGSSHMIVAFPVGNEWLFVEPETNKFIPGPKAGAKYYDNVIEQVDILRAYWEPFEVKDVQDTN